MAKLPALLKKQSLLIASISLAAWNTPAHSQELSEGAALMQRYDVVWNSASKDPTGLMPIGNGDMAASVGAMESGDIVVLMAKNDAYNRRGDILKTGRLKINLSPNPFADAKSFRQTLNISTATVSIEANGVKVEIWVDANKPVLHVQIASPEEISVTTAMDPFERIVLLGGVWVGKWSKGGPQDVLVSENNELISYYTVGDSSGAHEEFANAKVPEFSSFAGDPYRFNTFGNLVKSPNLTLTDGLLTGKGKEFDIQVFGLTQQAPDPKDWIAGIRALASMPLDTSADRKLHLQWWSDFWNRSWIVASDNTLTDDKREKFLGEGDKKGRRNEDDGAALVSQSYNVFRYLMACQSRGKMQSKFNGGLFTQQLRVPGTKEKIVMQGGADPGAIFVEEDGGYWLTHPDWRLWGSRYTFQNQRLLYWPMLMSGDRDLIKPFFDFYFNTLETKKKITKAWFGHEGAFYRENTSLIGGEEVQDAMPPKSNPGGPYTPGWVSYYFTAGLEKGMIMIEYAKYSQDKKFRDEVMLPFVREVLLFFDKHYARDETGKIHLDPSQAAETFWFAVNPATDIGGLTALLDEMLAMGVGSDQDKAEWKRFRAEIPELHMHEIEGDLVIAPALKWENKRNMDNPELYPVFPFQRYGVANGTGDLVARTAKHRTSKGAWGGGWSQDEIHWAYGGNSHEASVALINRARRTVPIARFPVYGPHLPDSTPNFCHTGSGATALQRMIVQEAGDKIALLPAWPKNWDVNFKLHLAKNTVISGIAKNGELIKWDISPTSRKKDVTVCWESAPKL